MEASEKSMVVSHCFSTTQKTVHSQTNSSPSKPFPNPASDRPSTPNQEASPPPSQPSVMPDPLSLQALAPAVHSEVSVWVAVTLSEAEAEEEAEAGARRVADRSLVALLFLPLNHIRSFDLHPGPASVSLFVPTCLLCRSSLRVQPLHASFFVFVPMEARVNLEKSICFRDGRLEWTFEIRLYPVAPKSNCRSHESNVLLSKRPRHL